MSWSCVSVNSFSPDVSEPGPLGEQVCQILGIAYVCLSVGFLKREFTETVLSRSGRSYKEA